MSMDVSCYPSINLESPGKGKGKETGSKRGTGQRTSAFAPAIISALGPNKHVFLVL